MRFLKSYLLVWSAESRLSYWQNFKNENELVIILESLLPFSVERRINFTLRASFGLGFQSFSFACHCKQKWKVFVHYRQFDIRISQNTIPLLSQAVLSLISLYDSSLLECFKFINSYFCNTQNWLWQRRLGTWSYYCFNKKECHRYWKTIIWLKMA